MGSHAAPLPPELKQPGRGVVGGRAAHSAAAVCIGAAACVLDTVIAPTTTVVGRTVTTPP